MRKLTCEEFIARAREIHGTKYDYSQVEYVNNSTKVKIICSVHGVFEQSPQKHMKGHGCPDKTCIDQHRRATNLAKFGVENVMQVGSVKQGRADAFMEKYGVENPMQVQFVQDGRRRVRESKKSDRKLINTPINFSRTVKQYQFDVFYERELALWQQNPTYRGMPLQEWLYHNRMKYLGKRPDELTQAEIMRGFTISGILKGYTVFDTSLMHEAVQKYGIKSVYDPCAGWGERMLYCYHNGLQYLGVDVNQKLKPGYEAMIDDLNMQDQRVMFADSGTYTPTGHVDAIICCPPYGDTEIYSLDGAENLSEQDFMAWWRRVVKNASRLSPEYFCLQVNQKWHGYLVSVIRDAGFKQVDEFFYKHSRSSHMTRRGGRNRKHEYESMVVMARV